MKKFLSKSFLSIILLSGAAFASCKNLADLDELESNTTDVEEKGNTSNKGSEEVVVTLNDGETEGETNQENPNEEGEGETEEDVILSNDFTKLDTTKKIEKYSREYSLMEEQPGDIYDDEEIEGTGIILKLSRKKVVLGYDPTTGESNIVTITGGLFNTQYNFQYDFSGAELLFESSDPSKVEVIKSSTGDCIIQAVGGNFGDEVTITAKYGHIYNSDALDRYGITTETVESLSSKCKVTIGNYLPMPQLETTDGYHLTYIPQSPIQYLESVNPDNNIQIRIGETDSRFFVFYKVEDGNINLLCNCPQSDSFSDRIDLIADQNVFYDYSFPFINVRKVVTNNDTSYTVPISFNDYIGTHLLRVDLNGFNKGTESNPTSAEEKIAPYTLTGDIKYSIFDFANDNNTSSIVLQKTFNIITI